MSQKNSNVFLISRLCNGCEQTFKTRRGLQSHSKRASPASLCRRYGDQKIKFAKIKATNERRFLAKNIKPSEVDLESWDGKIKKGTIYDTNAKTLCLNAIKVSIKMFFPYDFRLRAFKESRHRRKTVLNSVSNGQCSLLFDLLIQILDTDPCYCFQIHRARNLRENVAQRKIKLFVSVLVTISINVSNLFSASSVEFLEIFCHLVFQ